MMYYNMKMKWKCSYVKSLSFSLSIWIRIVLRFFTFLLTLSLISNNNDDDSLSITLTLMMYITIEMNMKMFRPLKVWVSLSLSNLSQYRSFYVLIVRTLSLSLSKFKNWFNHSVTLSLMMYITIFDENVRTLKVWVSLSLKSLQSPIWWKIRQRSQ